MGEIKLSKRHVLVRQEIVRTQAEGGSAQGEEHSKH